MDICQWLLTSPKQLMLSPNRLLVEKEAHPLDLEVVELSERKTLSSAPN